MHTHSRLFINGDWVGATGNRYTDNHDPASGDISGRLMHASKADLAAAVAASQAGFNVWRATSAFERCKIIRKAAALLRERSEAIAALMTREQGKPLREAAVEIALSADLLDWFAEEGRRAYGRVIPSRSVQVSQSVIREPVGPVAAFTPWNFPISQAVRKIGPALAAGCSMVIKPPEETPATTAVLAEVFHDAGLPEGVLNLVWGDPSEISEYLISHPVIRKVSFTGSVRVGKHIAALAGIYMKRCTMELGGHAPAIVCDDADIDTTVRLLAFSKYRNCGQVCVSPTRFLIQSGVYEIFRQKFVAEASRLQVGPGDAPQTTMGPLISARRMHAVDELIADAVEHGASLDLGGKRIGNAGNFLTPTVLSDVTPAMRIMNEEPFGPVALLARFDTIDQVIEEGNRLPYGLASYAFTRSSASAARLAAELEVGMLSINHLGLGLPETPFGGVKDSGYGSEGGTEAIESYLVTKFISHASV
ncbi:NAD-dependent succinate-semialdehyde dehydrogenase [Herbaspirillum autotrophicum]|uniref:NAD-dependent succinate-semialdehyde dehydrogenase n=1 Tax=Herbaspirillum autotrophicum TaxID=180195 RepID=UPI00067B0B3E|nr:NAD-dependent succinate-semialdehyde dehydrogenase [Herbaspirillum autotrophicum]